MEKQSKVTTHVSAKITQDLVNLVAPRLDGLVLLDVHIPFRKAAGSEVPMPSDYSYLLEEDEIREMIRTAREADDDFNSQIKKVEEEVNATVDFIEEHKARCENEENPTDWEGPPQEELDAMRAMSFPVAVHLSHLHVVVTGPPAITISGQTSHIDSFNVRVSATVQIWWKMPKVVGCIAKCPWPFNDKCCIPKIAFVWTQKGHVDASIEFRSKIIINASIANNSLWLSGLFRELRINKPYFDKIKLENIANRYVGDKRHEVLRLGALVATIPVIDQTYGISGAQITGSDGIQVNIEVSQL